MIWKKLSYDFFAYFFAKCYSKVKLLIINVYKNTKTLTKIFVNLVKLNPLWIVHIFDRPMTVLGDSTSTGFKINKTTITYI